MSKTVRIGVMPGRINEFAVEESTTLREALAIAELDASGYEVKADGVKVENLDQTVGSTSLILLAKQVKGNASVRIGVMPGRINEFAVEGSTTFRQALEIAELDASGYEVKADGVKVENLDAEIGSTSLILLAKQVKGNSSVRIGVMPGRINEFAIEPPVTFREALQIAELDPSGYEVKADGVKIEDLDREIGSTSLILLAKQVKGN